MLVIATIISFCLWYFWWATLPRMVLDGKLWRIIADTNLAQDADIYASNVTLSNASAFPSFGTLIIGNELITYNCKIKNIITSFLRHRQISNHSCGDRIFGVKNK